MVATAESISRKLLAPVPAQSEATYREMASMSGCVMNRQIDRHMTGNSCCFVPLRERLRSAASGKQPATQSGVILVQTSRINRIIIIIIIIVVIIIILLDTESVKPQVYAFICNKRK